MGEISMPYPLVPIHAVGNTGMNPYIYDIILEK
jgi:hypothetical protein